MLSACAKLLCVHTEINNPKYLTLMESKIYVTLKLNILACASIVHQLQEYHSLANHSAR